MDNGECQQVQVIVTLLKNHQKVAMEQQNIQEPIQAILLRD